VCFILLAGGEPLLRMDVLEAAGRHPGIIFPVFTNGLLINESILDFFDSHRNLVPVVSLEGGREATDARRGAGVYDRIDAAMRQMRSRRIFFGSSITVTRANIGDVACVDFAKDLRRKGCSLAFYVEYVPADLVSRELAPTDQERMQLENSIRTIRESVRMMVISFPGDEKETGGCLAAGRGFVHVNMDGRVEPCPFSPYSDTNLKDITLAQALDSPFLKRMRADGFLLGEHDGGCLLFDKQEEVRAMLKDCKA
jgi:MoaA/NifB/PqqE/SkfB family radical SAM enzyme